MTMTDKNNRIDYIEIPVNNIENAKQFYGNIFGWQFVDYGPDYTSFNDGRLDGGFRKETDHPTGGPLIVIYADNLETTLSNILDASGLIVQDIFDFPGGRRFHFTDLSGNELAVWSDK